MSAMENLTDKLAYLVKLLRELRSILPSSLEEYTTNLLVRRTAERLAQLIVECAGEINSFIAEITNVLPGDTLYATFIQAAEAGALPRPLATQLAEWAKTRNILVHQYNHIDDVTMYHNLQPLLEQFSLFVKHVQDFMDAQQSSHHPATE